MKDQAPSLSRCWLPPSWDSLAWDKASLGDRVWCGSAPSSQLKTSASQWPLHRTSLMPGTVRTFPGSRQLQLHKIMDVPVILRQAFVSRAALTWSGRRWPRAPGLPLEIVRCRRFRVALWWLQALFSVVLGPLVRIPEGNNNALVRAFWGFADVLFEMFKPVAWCATPLTKNDPRKFRASIGASKHNTTWEALALRGSWRASRLIHCQWPGAWCGLSRKSADLNVAGLGRRLGLELSGAHESHPGCTPQTTTDVGTSTAPSTAVSWAPATTAGSRSGSLVLEDRRCKAQEWNTGKKAHTVGTLTLRRVSRASLSGPASHPTPTHCVPPRHTWAHNLPVRPCEVTLLSEGFASPAAASRPCPPAHAALVPARAHGTTVAVRRRRVPTIGARYCQ